MEFGDGGDDQNEQIKTLRSDYADCAQSETESEQAKN